MNKKPHENVTSDMRRALNECIRQTDQWRGSLTGGDPEALIRHDATIRKARSAIKILNRGGKYK